MLELVPSTLEHGEHVAANLRAEERLEVMLSHGASPREAVMGCLTKSVDQHTVMKGGDPIAITGLYLVSTTGGSGSPWLLTTPELQNHKMFLVRNTRKLLAKWLEHKPVLYNNVHAEYEGSLNWARHSGFTVYPARPYGMFGAPFNYIEIRRQ